MRHPKKELQDFERFEEVLQILAKQGFGALLDHIDVSEHIPGESMARKREPGPERLRETFEQLGPTFIKFGQIMAQRPDIIPERYAKELEKLEDDVPSFSTDKAMEIIDEEVGLDSFEHVKQEPIAAASIAQVHRARLKSGEDVVVKVRRPEIKQEIEKDLDILEFLAGKAEKEIDKLEQLKASKIVEEFASWTRDELDLKKEGKNAIRLSENLEDEEKVEVPEIYMEHTTEKILAMEYEEGIKCDNSKALGELSVEAEDIAKTAIRAGLKQVIRDGFFHADPHPSNFLIREDGKLVYLDFGMMGRFSKDMQNNIGLLFLHAANEDVSAAVDIIKEMAVVEDDADEEGLKQEIEKKLLLVRNSSLEEHSISKELLDITIKASEKGFHMPVSFAIVGKSLVTMEGIGLSIYPQFQVTDEYEEIAREILMEKNDPKQLAENFFIDLIENKEMVSRPFTQLKKLKQGRKEIASDQREFLGKQLLAAGLFISSALIITETVSAEILTIIGLGQLAIAVILLIQIAKN